MEKSKEIESQRFSDEVKLHVAIDIGLAFSAMMRLFEKDSKSRLHNKVHSELPRIFHAKTKPGFERIHSELCEWGTEEISLAKKKRNEQIGKQSKKASYGQIAKTLDVVLKVVIYYSHFPDCRRAKELSKLLNAAMDRKMMASLKKYVKGSNMSRKLPETVKSWPKNIEDVCDKETYDHVQKTVREYKEDKCPNLLFPVQFEDYLWAKVNKKPWWKNLNLYMNC